LNFEYYIANRLKGGKRNKLSQPVIKISTISIALGLALMIISVAVVIGFKKSVSSKVMGFASHINLVFYDNSYGMQGKPVITDNDLVDKLISNGKIKQVQFAAEKAGVIKTKDQIQGVILKGIDNNYDSSFLVENIVDGKFPLILDTIRSNEILISKKLSDKLKLKVGEFVRMWFIDEEDSRARGRRFTISGIYNTGMEEIDNIYLIGDIKQIQKLNDWKSYEVGSIEILLNEIDDINSTAFELYNTIPYDLSAISVYDEYPQIFNWLDLLDMNVVVILTLLILVATITMISTLLILIIERTSMVGLLLAIGANSMSIRKLFIYMASRIILTGMVWGNIIGISFCLLQNKYKIISLAAESYYVDHVPVELNLIDLIMINSGTFIISLLVLIIPSFYIARIMPAKALRYE
jgi:lipoprotein-releasing system permease protein